MSRRTPPPDNPDRIIAADPIQRLLATIDAEIRLRTRRFSRAHVSLELELLLSFKADLEEALRDARSIEIVGNVKDAARLSKRSESTVRRICFKHGERAGAIFVEGEYSIHLPTFLRFEATLANRQRGSAGAVDDSRMSPLDPIEINRYEVDSNAEEAA